MCVGSVSHYAFEHDTELATYNEIFSERDEHFGSSENHPIGFVTL
jgi:hypothetical protein